MPKILTSTTNKRGDEMKNADMPAMPCSIPVNANYLAQSCGLGVHQPSEVVYSGLTKRERMEINFMSALITLGGYHSFELMARDAVGAASALIAEQERTCQKS